jgi:hypothetical protein
MQPGNCEALRYIVQMCQELGRPAEVERYGEMLRRAERAEVRPADTVQGNSVQQRWLLLICAGVVELCSRI